MKPDERGGAEALLDANSFHVDGPIRFSYTSSSIAGVPTVSYKDAERELNVQGDSITRMETSVGEMVSVTIQDAVDAFVRTFSVLVPKIRIAKGTEAEFDAVGVETTDRSLAFVGAPGARGVLQTYRVHNLHGTAEAVDF